MRDRIKTHNKYFRGRERPFGTAGQSLVSDEVGEEVRQNPEQR
jgi:hypothetical protein